MEKKTTTRQARAVETRKKIIQAAKVLIAAKGFADTSIEDIAKQAGVSTGSFYTYFILDRLRYYCREFLGDIEETGIEICRQWLKNNLSPNDMFLGGTYITKYRYDDQTMRSILQEAVTRGELRSDAPLDDLALLINTQLYGLMVAWCMTDGQVKGSEKTDVLCSIVLQAALAPYRQANHTDKEDT